MVDEPQAPEADSSEVLECDVDGCDEVFTGRTASLKLGQHKRRAHGIQGRDSRGRAGSSSPSSSSSSPSIPKIPAAGDKTDEELRASIKEIYVLISSIVSVRDPHCGAAVGEIADKAAREWVNYAKGDPEFRRRLEMISGVSYVPLVVAHLPLVQAVKAHHVDPVLERRAAARAGFEPAAGGGWIPTNGAEDPARQRFEEAVSGGPDPTPGG